jgi:hypothetical protein
MARSPACARTVSGALIALLSISLFAASSALAGHLSDWTHDHSDAGVPPRPSGLAGLNDVFGPRCSDKANNARSWWPNADTDPFGAGKYVYYHTYLARNVGFNIRNHINAAHRDGALYPGSAATTVGSSRGRRPGRSTPGERRSIRTGSGTRGTRRTGTAEASTGPTTARTSPTCGGEDSPAIGSSGASAGTRRRIPCTSSTSRTTDLRGGSR